MRHLPLGKSDLLVSRICLGSWQAYGWSTSSDKEFFNCIDTALESGINFIDTAAEYGKGHSERLIGEALKGRRDKIVIGTKFFYNRSAREKIRTSLESSLKNLRTDYIDLFQQHWPPKSPALEETLDELSRLKAEGKIRAIGVSNWEEREFSEVSDLTRIDSLQPCYNILWRKGEENIFPLCQEKNISVLPYSPLCQGLLTGKFARLEDIPKDPRRQNVFTRPEVFPEVQKFLLTLNSIAIDYHASPSEIALAWLLAQPFVTSIIVGCSKPQHVHAACQSIKIELRADTLMQLELASMPFQALLKNYKSLWDWRPRG